MIHGSSCLFTYDSSEHIWTIRDLIKSRIVKRCDYPTVGTRLYVPKDTLRRYYKIASYYTFLGSRVFPVLIKEKSFMGG